MPTPLSKDTVHPILLQEQPNMQRFSGARWPEPSAAESGEPAVTATAPQTRTAASEAGDGGYDWTAKAAAAVQQQARARTKALPF